MNAPTMAGASVLAFALMALAGCTGSFNVDQTEPFRVQLDGAPQTVVVREGAEPREVNVETCPDTTDPCDVEEVNVQVDVHKTSAKACSIKVIIKTVSGDVLDEKVIDVGDDDDGSASASATATGGNETDSGSASASATATGGSGDTTVQNLIVNVKGNKNIIVVTQALQGEANVNIQAIKASGHSTVDADQDTTSSASATMSSTNTTTSPY
ncbi:MAG: hypothetical protein QOC71_462 [Thermoplasmata archaeon]|nr:hypothetical protein [Thermoplasmata archaeon]